MEVLHPERFLVLGGGQVTVREYGNVEWLRALPAAEPLVAAIAAMLATGQDMNCNYKETARGGLAVSVIAC